MHVLTVKTPRPFYDRPYETLTFVRGKFFHYIKGSMDSVNPRTRRREITAAMAARFMMAALGQNSTPVSFDGRKIEKPAARPEFARFPSAYRAVCETFGVE